MAIPHPARYSDPLLPAIADYVRDCHRILDPFGGTGKLAELKKLGIDAVFFVNELEPEWAVQAVGKADVVSTMDACNLPFPEHCFDAVVTSPVYGNRMSDHHTATDDSKRLTYRHCLGRPLSAGNAGMLQWGDRYRQLHERAWQEARRVLVPAGKLVLNVSDHIRQGEVMPVSAWHVHCLQQLGFQLMDHQVLPTKRLRYGRNHTARVAGENLYCFQRD